MADELMEDLRRLLMAEQSAANLDELGAVVGAACRAELDAVAHPPLLVARRDYGPAGACQRKAAVLLLIALSVAGAVVWGGWELVSSLSAAVVVPGLPHPATHHARRGWPAVLDEVRHVLLQVLGVDTLRGWTAVESLAALRRREWHLVACAVGDFVERIAQLAAVVVIGGLLVGGALASALLAPLWFNAGLVGMAVCGLVVWRLRAAGRRLSQILDDELAVSE